MVSHDAWIGVQISGGFQLVFTLLVKGIRTGSVQAATSSRWWLARSKQRLSQFVDWSIYFISKDTIDVPDSSMGSVAPLHTRGHVTCNTCRV